MSRRLRSHSKNEYPRLKREAWKWWSIVVRIGSVFNKRGEVECFTCGKKLHWKKAHASHYMHGKLDFNPINIHACCAKCNTFMHGNLGNYLNRLIQETGNVNIHDELKEMARQEAKLTRDDLRTLIERLKKQAIDLGYT